jgi:hypothetical protein
MFAIAGNMLSNLASSPHPSPLPKGRGGLNVHVDRWRWQDLGWPGTATVQERRDKLPAYVATINHGALPAASDTLRAAKPVRDICTTLRFLYARIDYRCPWPGRS